MPGVGLRMILSTYHERCGPRSVAWAKNKSGRSAPLARISLQSKTKVLLLLRHDARVLDTAEYFVGSCIRRMRSWIPGELGGLAAADLRVLRLFSRRTACASGIRLQICLAAPVSRRGRWPRWHVVSFWIRVRRRPLHRCKPASTEGDAPPSAGLQPSLVVWSVLFSLHMLTVYS